MAGGSLGRLNVILGLNSTEFTAGLSKADMEAKRRLDNIGKSAKLAGAAFAAAFAATTGVMAVMVKQSIDNMDAMAKLAQASGTTVEALNALTYAGALSDVSNEQMGKSLSRLTQSMSDTSQGTGEAIEAFRALGISVTESDGSLRGSDKVLADIAERFAGMRDGAGKTALAIDIFGRSGAALIPLLNSGRDGLAQVSTEASRLGLVFDTETAKAAEAFNDNLTRLQKVQEGWVNQITAEVLPALVDFSDFAFEVAASTGDVHTAVRDLSEFIGLQEWFDDVGKSIATTLDELAMLYKAVQVVVGSFENLFQKSREWLAFDAMDKTGLVALVNPDLAKKQVAEYEQVLKDRNSTIDRNNQTLFELLNGDKRKFRNLWDGRDGNAFDVDLMGFDVQQMAPNIVKAGSGKKGKAKKAERNFLADDLDEYLIRIGEADEWLESYELKADKTFDKVGEFSLEAARSIQNSLGDGLYDILSGNFDDIGAKFGETLLRMAADAQAAQLAKAMFGDFDKNGQIGGIIGNVFGRLFGNALTGVTASPTLDLGATIGSSGGITTRTFDSGGYTGHGGKHDPAGIVHKGEYVLNQAATRRMGVGMLDRINKGYANGGLVGGGAGAAGGGAPVFNIINQSSQPVQAKSSGPMFNGKEYVTTIVLSDLRVNGPIAQGVKGVMGR